ncbi:hypothetical protein DMENIID0001_093200 [Sergentomyia squamirostris]
MLAIAGKNPKSLLRFSICLLQSRHQQRPQRSHVISDKRAQFFFCGATTECRRGHISVSVALTTPHSPTIILNHMSLKIVGYHYVHILC